MGSILFGLNRFEDTRVFVEIGVPDDGIRHSELKVNVELIMYQSDPRPFIFKFQ